MPGLRTTLVWLLFLLLLAGCQNQQHFLRPPKQPEEIAGVPPTDPRYNNPPQYPADAMRAPGKKAAINNANGPGGGMGGMGGMSGMRPTGLSTPMR
jgi:hypothetical protein